MRPPESLQSLLELGIIEEVVRPLMSGKEAEVYLVLSQGKQHVAKVYKEAQDRTFKHRSLYTEGRQVRSSRDRRAMNKRSAYGRAKQESAWRDVEADVIFRLRDLGVRVPEPKDYVDSVLVMELVCDAAGRPAPRLADLSFSRERAEELFAGLVGDVQKMLCGGLVHGDLSEFNILAGRGGPVIIDFPQAVDASKNQNARRFLLRDVGNLRRFFGRFSRRLRRMQYGEEMWHLYERGELRPDTELTGRYSPKKKKSDVSSLLEEIQELERENRERREALGLPPPRAARKPRAKAAEAPKTQPEPKAKAKAKAKDEHKPKRPRRRRKPVPQPKGRPAASPGLKGRPEQSRGGEQAAKPSAPAKARRRRRRRRRNPGAPRD